MAKADLESQLNVGADALFSTVTGYEDYTKFVDGVSRVEVISRSEGKARVKYHVSMIKDISYVLDHTEDKTSGVISWKLVESDFMKVNNGKWSLKAQGDSKCQAKYEVEVEFKIPVPGFVLNKLIKSSLPSMVKSFEKQALKAKKG